MNKIIQKVASAVMAVALVLSAVQMPIINVAHAQGLDSGFDFSFPSFDFGLPSLNLPSLDLPSTNLPTVSLPTTDLPSLTLPTINLPTIDLGSPTLTTTSCRVTADNTEVFAGGSVNLQWETSGFNQVTINGQVMNTINGNISMTNIVTNTTYTMVATTADGKSTCTSTVRVTCLPAPIDCRLELNKVVDKSVAAVGDTLTYTVTIKNVGSTDCTGSGVKIEDVLSDKLSYLTHTNSFNITPGYDGGVPVYTSADRTMHFNGNVLNPGERGTFTVSAKVNQPATCGNFEVANQARATAAELSNFSHWASSNVAKTAINNACPVVPTVPVPACTNLSLSSYNVTAGQSVTLNWAAANASYVTISGVNGNQLTSGSVNLTPAVSTIYSMVVYGQNGQTARCETPITVNPVVVTPPNPAPICDSFSASAATITAGSGTILNWNTSNASKVVIDNFVGEQAADGSVSVGPTTSTTYKLVAYGTDGRTVECTTPITVNPAPVASTLTCAANVQFTASKTSINPGDSVTLNWSTNNVDSLTIQGLTTTALSGSTAVALNNDTTYTLVARRGANSVSCPVAIDVIEPTNNGGSSNGGGGGGSSAPRCELTISDNKISAGQKVTLSWDTSRATDVLLKDNHGKTLIDTDDYKKDEKKDHLDDSIEVKPTRDTEYTLTASRGSKDRNCKVKVDVSELTVLTDREPTTGISLEEVPYTGFEAGPLLTLLFYVLLVAWALFVTYLIVMRRQPVASNSVFAGAAAMKQVSESRPDLFPQTVTAAVASVAAPANLPVATPVSGYENHVETGYGADVIVTAIENRAHAQNALLSSDAVRYFMATTEGTVERNEALDAVIASAKGSFPLEDGWIVVNEARMQQLCATCIAGEVASTQAPFVPTVVPAGSSSLAEAIVTGNIVAAYEMIGNRPMFALADAAADFDNVVRARKGENTQVSSMLATEAGKLSEEKIKNIVAALTGALDGTYTDEASAVKMAIMKAVKEVA